MSSLPSPAALLGLPDSKFSDWYPGQSDLCGQILDWLSSPERFLGVSAATGGGKTLLALIAAKLSGLRTVILTATKGLQRQYETDCVPLGGTLVMGQNNFLCPPVVGLTADLGPCHEGLPCKISSSPSGGCPYRDQLRRALASRIVVTNYAYYLAQTQFSSGLGDIQLLVADEAHHAFSAMENFLTIYLARMDVESLGLSFPTVADQFPVWQSWADSGKTVAQDVTDKLESDIKAKRSAQSLVPAALSHSFRVAKSTTAKLNNLSSAQGNWVIERVSHGYRFVPRWVSGYSDKLFQNVPKVMLMSAILSHKTADSLGIPPAPDRKWIEVGSYFPPENTPIWHIPCTRVNYHTDDYGATLWVSRIDQIISRRLDRKGIVFTVSYERARLLMQRSRFAQLMLTHSTGDVTYVVNRFKAAPAPKILVSPSVTTGYDFPGNGKPQYIIVGKLPYPDTKDPVTQARHKDDKDWSSFMAMDVLIQETGRMTRSAEDRCEVFVVDDSIIWYWHKYKVFAPRWFQERYRGSLACVPDPLFKIVAKEVSQQTGR